VTEAPLPLDVLEPPAGHVSLLAGIRRANAVAGTRLVVLDDDPLGGQCVHDVPVLTAWEPAALEAELRRSPVFLLLINTRSMPRADAVNRAAEVGRALRDAQATTGLAVTPIWRSDSTLRGHFYWEMEAFDSTFAAVQDARPVYVFLPYFGEGGRVTLNDTQYALQDPPTASGPSRASGWAMLVPVADTEFARDPAFAYTQSHLPSWLEAHSEGRIKAGEAVCISLTDLRHGGPPRVAEVLATVADGAAVIVNATSDADLEVFVAGQQRCGAPGRRFLCTGAAPFVRVRAGLEARPFLEARELGLKGQVGGLIVAGSYAARTSAQVEAALALPAMQRVELDLTRVDSTSRAAEIAHVSQQISRRLAAGEDVILHTARDYRPNAERLIGQAFDEVVAGLTVRPRYVVVKGGTTASHLATNSLAVSRAVVLGRLISGVPVWRLGDESRWPGLPFVIFPGNVGTQESLSQALLALRGG
jgi:uncharacterized protein YgbK (DUF1537 family)